MSRHPQSIDPPLKLTELLRSQTRSAHEGVEAALGKSLNEITLDRYGALLAAWQEIHRYLEPAIAMQLPIELATFVQSRSRTHWLEQDLASLNQAALIAKPFGRAELPIDQPADALGSLYVLEGSTLGGQILCKRFAETLPLTTETGLRYFNSYGQQTALRWRETKQLLDDPRWIRHHSAIVAAANRTFEALTRYFATP